MVAERWAAALAPVLRPGEEILAFVRIARFEPQTEALAVTDFRLIGFESFSMEPRRIVLEAAVGDIQAIDIAPGPKTLLVTTSAGRVNFGAVSREEARFLRPYIDYLVEASAGGLDELPRISHEVRAPQPVSANQPVLADRRPVKKRRRSLTRVYGSPMDDGSWSVIRDLCGPDENPWMIVNNAGVGFLAAFDDRLLISKSQANLGGRGHLTTRFLYSEIIRIDLSVGIVNDVLEVHTWRNRDAAELNRANTLPLPKELQDKVRLDLDDLRRRASDANRPPVSMWKPPLKPRVVEPKTKPADGLVSEIRSLADLYTQGLITDEEFGEAKRAVIASHTRN
ncbi:SHOCT domain-containing protein [Williamsia soli]|uniref:SHOCT domain-containing protein n=1 Tax=Williamsia soli TaxID=364929 RepID=UPI001A9FBC11|nr:SHOCT domain-containing protein [Williamsia soli]